MSNNTLCAIAAHEAGHIHAGDARIIRMFYAFSSIGRIVEWFANLFTTISGFLLSFRSRPIIFVLLLSIWLTCWTLKLVFTSLIKISNFIMLSVSREAEFAADKYAHNLGYGEGLKNFFYFLLEKEKENNQAKGGASTLFDTHPATSKRIQALENLDEKKLTEDKK